RREARVGDEGELVLLEDQDRSKWRRPQIEAGVRLVEEALLMRRPGSYQGPAAIAAGHAGAAAAAGADRPPNAVLFDQPLPYQRTTRIQAKPAVSVYFA